MANRIGQYMEEIINSTANQRIKKWALLKTKKGRDEQQAFIIEQPHLIGEALKADLILQLLIRHGTTNPFDYPALMISDNVMHKLSSNVSLNDCLAICKLPKSTAKTLNRVIVLENVQDPGNIGTIMRTALAFGYDALFIDEGCADIYNEKTIKASQGALFYLPVYRQNTIKTLQYLKQQKVTLIATTPHQASEMAQTSVNAPYAIILGNEGQGLTNEVLDKADLRIKIEMFDFESLNVATAMAVGAYYYRFIGPKE